MKWADLKIKLNKSYVQNLEKFTSNVTFGLTDVNLLSDQEKAAINVLGEQPLETELYKNNPKYLKMQSYREQQLTQEYSNSKPLKFVEKVNLDFLNLVTNELHDNIDTVADSSANSNAEFGSRLPFNDNAFNIVFDTFNNSYSLGGQYSSKHSFTDYVGEITVKNPGVPKFSLEDSSKIKRELEITYSDSKSEDKILDFKSHFKGYTRSIKSMFDSGSDIDLNLKLNLNLPNSTKLKTKTSIFRNDNRIDIQFKPKLNRLSYFSKSLHDFDRNNLAQDRVLEKQIVLDIPGLTPLNQHFQARFYNDLDLNPNDGILFKISKASQCLKKVELNSNLELLNAAIPSLRFIYDFDSQNKHLSCYEIEEAHLRSTAFNFFSNNKLEFHHDIYLQLNNDLHNVTVNIDQFNCMATDFELKLSLPYYGLEDEQIKLKWSATPSPGYGNKFASQQCNFYDSRSTADSYITDSFKPTAGYCCQVHLWESIHVDSISIKSKFITNKKDSSAMDLKNLQINFNNDKIKEELDATDLISAKNILNSKSMFSKFNEIEYFISTLKYGYWLGGLGGF